LVGACAVGGLAWLGIHHWAHTPAGEVFATDPAISWEALTGSAKSLGKVFQPTPGQQTAFSQVHHAPASQPATGPFYVRDCVPYSSYRYGVDESAFVFHPSSAAAYLFAHAGEPDAPEMLEAICRLGVGAPNGGLVWFYPGLFRNARTLGPDLRYSALAQAQMLIAFVRLSRENPCIPPGRQQEAFRGLTLPYDEGGVLLDGQAWLEWPLYRNAPEIVLNGWLSALMHVADYAAATGDAEAARLYERNIRFLAAVLPCFDAPDQQLSRYSDLSPYEATLRLDDTDGVTVTACYVPRFAGLSTYLCPIRRLDNAGRSVSPYDNQITKVARHELRLTLGCSQLFRTVLLVNKPGARLDIDAGLYVPTSATPVPGGRKFTVTGQPVPQGTVIALDAIDPFLIRGYPTNFVKEITQVSSTSAPASIKRNFYHVYHVVALLGLAQLPETPADARAKLVRWALRWHQYTLAAPTNQGQFADPDHIVAGLNAFKLRPLAGFPDLLHWAQTLPP
jgi:hypothetical protein